MQKTREREHLEIKLKRQKRLENKCNFPKNKAKRDEKMREKFRERE